MSVSRMSEWAYWSWMSVLLLLFFNYSTVPRIPAAFSANFPGAKGREGISSTTTEILFFVWVNPSPQEGLNKILTSLVCFTVTPRSTAGVDQSKQGRRVHSGVGTCSSSTLSRSSALGKSGTRAAAREALSSPTRVFSGLVSKCRDVMIYYIYLFLIKQPRVLIHYFSFQSPNNLLRAQRDAHRSDTLVALIWRTGHSVHDPIIFYQTGRQSTAGSHGRAMRKLGTNSVHPPPPPPHTHTHTVNLSYHDRSNTSPEWGRCCWFLLKYCSVLLQILSSCITSITRIGEMTLPFCHSVTARSVPVLLTFYSTKFTFIIFSVLNS